MIFKQPLKIETGVSVYQRGRLPYYLIDLYLVEWGQNIS